MISGRTEHEFCQLQTCRLRHSDCKCYQKVSKQHSFRALLPKFKTFQHRTDFGFPKCNKRLASRNFLFQWAVAIKVAPIDSSNYFAFWINFHVSVTNVASEKSSFQMYMSSCATLYCTNLLPRTKSFFCQSWPLRLPFQNFESFSSIRPRTAQKWLQ